jgi:hypothetical protein
MIFADMGLARRLERPEALAGMRFVEARRRLSPGRGAECMVADGVHAIFDGPASPVTQTFGLGLAAEPSVAALDRLESFFRERGAPVRHEVSPLAGTELADQLCGRGYRPIEFTNVMFKALLPDSGSPDRPPSQLHTRLMNAGEEELWARTSARGWAGQPEFTDLLLDTGRLMASMDGVFAYFAHLRDEPVATGGLWCHEGVALFGGASTVPEARNQGGQRALFAARMDTAAKQGCDIAMMCAHPGSASQRNAERQGFRIAYTRIKWELAPKEHMSPPPRA